MIEVDNVSKYYRTRSGPHYVLSGVSMKLAKGEKIGIVGRNGSGKSTLVRLIGGAEAPSAGSVRRNMSVSWPLAFGGAFHAHLTGFDNLRFICRVYGVKFESVMPFVEDFTELGVFLREPVAHYSEGMRARLAFALSMAIEFDCFLIDEVISVGDSRFHDRCGVELFIKRKDRSLIIVSHDTHIIREHCTRAGILSNGKLALFDSVDEAYENYHAGTT